MRYTQEQYIKALGTDLAAYLEGKGFEMKRYGSEVLLINPRGVAISGNKWYDHYSDEGGGSIQFLVKYIGMSWSEAVLELAGESPVTGSAQQTPLPAQDKRAKKAFKLPESAPDYRRVLAYLCKTRGIDGDIIMYCLDKKLIYQSTEQSGETGKTYNNCVFVAYDENGEAKGATIRGAYSSESAPFRHDVEGSDKNITFHMEGKSRTIFVFESPIDLLSHASIQRRTGNSTESWLRNHRIALCGINDGPLEWYLDKHPEIERVVFCLDRDETGINAAAAHMDKYASRGYEVGCMLPAMKDWNDDLTSGAYKRTLKPLAEHPAAVEMEMAR